MVPDTNYCDIIVPTMDTVQMSYLLNMLLTNHRPVSAPAMPCLTETKSQVRGWLASYIDRAAAPIVHQTL